MPKRKLTEEQREVLRARLAKARAAKKAKPTYEPVGEGLADNAQPDRDATPNQNSEPQIEVQETISTSEYNELKKQIEELKSLGFGRTFPVQPQFGPQGSVIGTFEKYTVNPNHYPDPRERLSQEPRLATFAFPLNWELTWDVTVSEYPTIDGRRVKEPKFSIDLLQIWRDEDGLPTDKRIRWKRLIMHEDPQAAIAIANEQGLEVDESNEKAFLDEMRYLRVRDWLIEAFYPPKSDPANRRREEVIGNRLVEVFTVNGENSQNIPFSQMKKAKF